MGEMESKLWFVLQWSVTAVLWSVWLQQDMSNIAVFLPRSLPVASFIVVLLTITVGLGLMIGQGGEKIQSVVEEKSRVKDIPEATLVDAIYTALLFGFKLNSVVPMSTTWVFIGLITGREIAIALRGSGKRSLRQALELARKDFLCCLLGFVIALSIGMAANQFVLMGFLRSFGVDVDAIYGEL